MWLCTLESDKPTGSHRNQIRVVPASFEIPTPPHMNSLLKLTPTTPVPPFTISDLLADLDNLRAWNLDRANPVIQLTWGPTIKIPCSFASKGLQITGPPQGEATRSSAGASFRGTSLTRAYHCVGFRDFIVLKSALSRPKVAL